MTKKNKKNKDITELVDQKFVEEVVSDITKQKRANNTEKFFLYRLFNVPTREAAKLCGYKENYGYDLNWKFKKNAKWRQRILEFVDSMPDMYKATCKLHLAQVAEIERKALETYRENPALAINKPSLLKQVKQTAGVIGDDSPPAQQFINIEQIQAIISDNLGSECVSQDRKKEADPKKSTSEV